MKACGEDYAVSYLSRANLFGNEITPKTWIAHDRLRANFAVMATVASFGFVIGKPDAPGARSWTPAADDEYGALSIRDKIREHRILANAALDRAGPQTRNKKPIPSADMPEPWRQWRAKAANHHAEVKRLGEKLAEARTT